MKKSEFKKEFDISIALWYQGRGVFPHTEDELRAQIRARRAGKPDLKGK